VWDQVRDQVGAQVWDQVGDQVWAQVGDSIYKAGYGLHDSGWLSFYDYFLNVCGLKVCERLGGLIQLAKSCGWFWPFASAVILTERPCAMYRDEDGRLHHPEKQAIEYPDGWGIHSWHGVRIPAEYYEQAGSPQKVLAETNVEVRRALIERYDFLHGKGQFMEDCGAAVIDRAPQPMADGTATENELLHISLPDDPDGSIVALRLNDPSTQRKYIVRVPPDMKRVRQALAWCADVTEDEYVLEQES
jgi:hypothetical protein